MKKIPFTLKLEREVFLKLENQAGAMKMGIQEYILSKLNLAEAPVVEEDKPKKKKRKKKAE